MGGPTVQISVDHVWLRVTHGTPSTGSLSREKWGDGLISGEFVSIPYTLSSTVVSGSPTANNSTDCNSWSNPSNAETSNNKYASAGPALGVYTTMYETFDFNIPSGNTITKVEVILEYQMNDEGGGDTVDISIGMPGTPDTCGNFIDYSPIVVAVFPNRQSEGIATINITSQRSWLPTDFDNANLRIIMNGFRGIV